MSDQDTTNDQQTTKSKSWPTRLLEWAERNKVIRKVAIFWIMWLITVVVLNVTEPSVLKDVNGAVATIVTGVIGIFSYAMDKLIKGDREE